MSELLLTRDEHPELYRVIDQLSSPFNQILIEIKKGDHKDFGLSNDSEYPLRGVTYPVEYGYLPGYRGEDGDKLDFFVGSATDEGESGSIKVSRPDVKSEHKYYINLSEEEVAAILKEFGPVILKHQQFDSLEALLQSIKKFKLSDSSQDQH